MKVHWWTYNHCLFVSYLTSVAFGCRWISDIKFQEFSDKDWIWILKNFSDMDQESKNQYPLISGTKGQGGGLHNRAGRRFVQQGEPAGGITGRAGGLHNRAGRRDTH